MGQLTIRIILGEKTALIDTVKASFSKEMLNKINQIINPLYFDYIVVNHMELEPDSMETFLEEDKILFSNLDSGSI
jgi:flavorubredoxin